MESKKRSIENSKHNSGPSSKKRQSSVTESIEDVNPQIFNDPVHGFIELHPLLVAMINTPQFQRLKDIKQLGVCYWVFPGASHNRFEHSLGTAYLCGKMIDTLRELHREKYEITDNEVLCVKIAGLCHDLGHGPFSHFFDGVYIPRVREERMKTQSSVEVEENWEHEDASCALFDVMVEQNPALKAAFLRNGLKEPDKAFIKELIKGKNPVPEGSKPADTVDRICGISKKPKWFLYEIVSNKRNGIDCDKFDYFARDCHNVGVTSNFDCRRYFQNIRIIPVDGQLQICVRDKIVFNLYELFHTRWSLHHRVYQHKTHAAIEHLLVEALLKVDQKLGISTAIHDMQRYSRLTDSIIYDILRNESGDDDIKQAQELILKIQRRDLYKFCGQTQQPNPDDQCLNENAIAIEMASLSNGELTAEEILVKIVNIHFGMKRRDPVESVVFFNKAYKPLKVRKNQVSQVLPSKFHERYVRMYAKSRDQTAAVQRCFEAWCGRHNYPVPHMLEGDPTGYFSPAAKIGAGAQSHMINPRNLEKEFEEIQA